MPHDHADIGRARQRKFYVAEEVIGNVLAEFDLTMGLEGCRSAAEIAPVALRPAE